MGNHHRHNPNTNHNHHHTNNNQHERRDDYPNRPAPGGKYRSERNERDFPNRPAPQSMKRQGLLERIKEHVKKKPATQEEIAQMELDVKKEELKTRKFKARRARPSFLGDGFGSGGGTRVRESSGGFGSFGSGGIGNFGMGGSLLEPSYEKPSKKQKQDSMGFGSGMNDMLGTGGGMDMGFSKSKGKKQNDYSFGSGLNDMFGL